MEIQHKHGKNQVVLQGNITKGGIEDYNEWAWLNWEPTYPSVRKTKAPWLRVALVHRTSPQTDIYIYKMYIMYKTSNNNI